MKIEIHVLDNRISNDSDSIIVVNLQVEILHIYTLNVYMCKQMFEYLK